MADIVRANVLALKDIKTPNGLRIAREGDRGRAEPGAKPHEAVNWNKVLVYWNGHRHGYWCEPAVLRFLRGKPEQFVAVRVRYDPFAGAAPVPENEVKYEFDFGRNLRKLREARRMTQLELGTAMTRYGVEAGQSTICYRESQSDCPGGGFVAAAARALAVPPFAFFVDLDNCESFRPAKEYLCEMSSALCQGG